MKFEMSIQTDKHPYEEKVKLPVSVNVDTFSPHLKPLFWNILQSQLDLQGQNLSQRFMGTIHVFQHERN